MTNALSVKVGVEDIQSFSRATNVAHLAHFLTLMRTDECCIYFHSQRELENWIGCKTGWRGCQTVQELSRHANSRIRDVSIDRVSR